MRLQLDPIKVSQLARDRGCNLMVIMDESPVYWVENAYFVGKPYSCLNELAQFLQTLPNFSAVPAAA